MPGWTDVSSNNNTVSINLQLYNREMIMSSSNGRTIHNKIDFVLRMLFYLLFFHALNRLIEMPILVRHQIKDVYMCISQLNKCISMLTCIKFEVMFVDELYVHMMIMQTQFCNSIEFLNELWMHDMRCLNY